MYEKIKTAIRAHIDKNRLVFWYDEDGDHRAILQELDIPATILEIQNNEWWIKYHVLKECPDDRFLIYADYPRPPDKDNWLLDLVLAGFSFSHDLAETYRQELGLDSNIASFVSDHVEFFQNSRERFEPLQNLVNPPNEDEQSLSLKMLWILTAPDSSSKRDPATFSRVFFALAEEAFLGGSGRWESVSKYGLSDAFRGLLRQYVSTNVDDLAPDGAVIAVFREAWNLERGGEATAARRNARVLLHEWRNLFDAGNRYRTIAKEVERVLGIAGDLESISLSELESLSLFPAVDSEIASRLVRSALDEKADLAELRSIAAGRKDSYWVRGEEAKLRSVYEMLVHYVDFRRALHTVEIRAQSSHELVHDYCESLYRVDQLHRQCLTAYRSADRAGTLSELVEWIDGTYVQQFLQPLAETWDKLRRAADQVLPSGSLDQRRFFTSVVSPFLSRGEKVVVIVSDGLRYEVGKELESRLAEVKRISATADAMTVAIPSITALGMSMLLPHDKVSLSSAGTVRVDGKSVDGVQGRSAHLTECVAKRFPNKKAAAFMLREIVELPTAAAREHTTGLDLIYLYSDTIDATADHAKTETSLPDAVESEIQRIVTAVRKFTNQLNRTHILITADHGFLYHQSQPSADQLISVEKPDGGSRERRYLIGGPAPGEHFRTASSDQLGLESEEPIHFVEGLYRIRKQGGGVRYVHGGTSIQELVVPVVAVHAGRKDDVEPVRVAILKAAKPIITAPTYSVTLFQEDPVSEKRPGVTLRIAFYSKDGTVLSDVAEVSFSSSDPNGENRSTTVEFHFAPHAVEHNGQDIQLRLERIIGGTAVPFATETYRYQTFGERDF